MLSSLRSRLWLSYALLIVTALSVVTIVLFVSLFRNPLLYRQTTERLRAVQAVMVARLQEENAPPLSIIAGRNAQTFNVRIVAFSPDRQVVFDTGSSSEALGFPEKKIVSLVRTLPIIRDETGSAWLYSIERLPDQSFLMVAVPRPRTSILTIMSDEFIPVIVFGGVIALLLSLVVAFLIAGWIASPLQEVVNAARGMPSAEVKPIRLTGPHEVQELMRAFNSMVARVQASQRSQRDFVANVSHEMKTPLTSIQGFSQALLDGTAETKEAQQKAARVIYSESERMHRMVLDLLDLAKLDAGTADLKMTPVNMQALLTAIVEKFTPQSQHAGVRLEMTLPANLPVLHADGDRIAQVFTNLIDNALKFTPSGGVVKVSASFERGEMTVTVSDTGQGIAETDLPHIFQRFYQADPARKGGEAHGAGLGLAIAQEIVAAHGGRISVRSRKDMGTTMEIILPLAMPETAKTSHKN